MKYLLDTCALLRWLNGDLQIASQVIEELNSSSNEVYVSSASIWEVRIKQQIGKLKLNANLSEVITSLSFKPLSINFLHADKVADLPMIHKDPFDRILIAQCLVEGMTIVTSDDIIG
ncbi:MAG: type II toxin-antitoxin system VapC family toxin [Endozoicomonas sp.]|uniref:type II toxin-antitoxin system VapC family toxin n=1 Tax=Endozoicomonas sp. TaxID=1892382 RepID=UPI003D9B7CF3